jgi:hypothetical protein
MVRYFTYFNYVLRNKYNGKYLCWNSFKSVWYWGKANHSEIFTCDRRLNKLLSQMEGSYVYLLKETRKDSLGEF